MYRPVRSQDLQCSAVLLILPLLGQILGLLYHQVTLLQEHVTCAGRSNSKSACQGTELEMRIE